MKPHAGLTRKNRFPLAPTNNPNLIPRGLSTLFCRVLQIKQNTPTSSSSSSPSSPSASSSPFTTFTVFHRPRRDYEFVALSVEMSPDHKLRSSSPPCLLFCCFHDGHAAAAAAAYHEAASSSDDCDDGSNPRKAARSPCSIRYKCRSLVARIGRCRRRQGHAAAAVSEFGYDPMSYALNFEEDRSRESDEEFPARNFLARLPGKLPRGSRGL